MVVFENGELIRYYTDLNTELAGRNLLRLVAIYLLVFSIAWLTVDIKLLTTERLLAHESCRTLKVWLGLVHLLLHQSL